MPPASPQQRPRATIDRGRAPEAEGGGDCGPGRYLPPSSARQNDDVRAGRKQMVFGFAPSHCLFLFRLLARLYGSYYFASTCVFLCARAALCTMNVTYLPLCMACAHTREESCVWLAAAPFLFCGAAGRGEGACLDERAPPRSSKVTGLRAYDPAPHDPTTTAQPMIATHATRWLFLAWAIAASVCPIDHAREGSIERALARTRRGRAGRVIGACVPNTYSLLHLNLSHKPFHLRIRACGVRGLSVLHGQQVCQQQPPGARRVQVAGMCGLGLCVCVG